MSIANVATRGYGPSAAIKFAATRGYSITAEAPVFDGPDIADRTWIKDSPIAAINLSDLFSGTIDDYSNEGTALPAGVGLNTSSGVISGTPTALGTTTGLKQAANVTSPSASTDTNTWQAEVIEVDLSAGVKNEIIYFQLGSAGFTGDLDDRLVQWFVNEGHTDGTLMDKWLAFLTAAGFTTGDIGDRQLDYYISLGADADSSLDDAERWVWLNAPPV